MFNLLTYIDLLDESKLPPNARFVDPYDHTPTLVQPGETLTNFISRILKSREKVQIDQLEPVQFRQLVVDCLYQSTPKKNQKLYFQEIKTPVSIAHAFSLLKALAYNAIHGAAPSLKQREERAQSCLPCKFHSGSSKLHQAVTNAVKQVVRIEQGTQSAAEKQLGRCGMCGCGLQAKVGVSTIAAIASLNPHQIDDMLAKYSTDAFTQCWMFREALTDPKSFEALYRKLAAMNSNTPRTIAALQYMNNKKPKT